MIAAVLISIVLFANSFSFDDLEAKQEQKRDQAGCMACQVGMGLALRLITSSSYFLLPKLSHYCEAVTNKDAKKLCLQFAEEFGDSFLEIVEAMLDPDTFCGAVGACQNK